MNELCDDVQTARMNGHTVCPGMTVPVNENAYPARKLIKMLTVVSRNWRCSRVVAVAIFGML